MSKAVTVDLDSTTFATKSITTIATTIPLQTDSLAAHPVNTHTITTPSFPSTSQAILVRRATTTAYPSSSALTPGQTAGVIVGVVVGVCIIMTALSCFCWRFKRQKRTQHKSGVFEPRRANQPETQQVARGAMLSPRQPLASNPVNSAGWRLWPSHDDVEASGTADASPERQSFLQRMTGTSSRSRVMLPISEPILESHVSLQQSLEERICAQPSPNPNSGDGVRRQVSDSTTIRTSCLPPTPVRPALKILRTGSTATSIATSAGNNSEVRDEVPPLPTFSGANLHTSTTNVAQPDGNGRQNLESKFRTSISKALSNAPITEGYDKRQSYRPTSRLPLRSPRTSTDDDSAVASAGQSTPRARILGIPIQHSLPSPFTPPVVPPRLSSRNAVAHPDEESLLPGKGRNARRIKKSKRKSQKAVRNSKSSSSLSSLKNLAMGRMPKSSSSDYHNISSISDMEWPKPPSKRIPKSRPQPRPSGDYKYSAKNLSLIKDFDSAAGPSNYRPAGRRSERPLQINIPQQWRSRGIADADLDSSSSESSNHSPTKAILTPRRLMSGELVLNVAI